VGSSSNVMSESGSKLLGPEPSFGLFGRARDPVSLRAMRSWKNSVRPESLEQEESESQVSELEPDDSELEAPTS
jgi:hypothetical protein